jgi:hypothetical protein
MSIKAGVGMSRHHNPSIAGREAAEQALEKVGVDKPDFVLMFGSSGYDQSSLLGAVREITGGAPLTGCSAAGTINGEDADESNFSVVVTVISSDELRWHNGLATGLGAEPRAVGQQVAQELLPYLSSDTIGLFVFPDGLTENFDHFIAGLEENLPNDQFLPLWGGGAGNNFNAEAGAYLSVLRRGGRLRWALLRAALGRGAPCLGHQPQRDPNWWRANSYPLRRQRHLRDRR